MTIRTQRLAAAAGMLVAVLAAWVPVRAWLGERALEQGRELQGRGDFLAAIGRYQFALARGRAQAADELARVALLRRRWDDAEALARRSLAMAPANAHPHLVLAAAALERPGEWDEAREERVLAGCRRAVALERASSTVWRDSGAILLELAGRRRDGWGPDRATAVLGQAETAFGRAVSLAPGAARRTLAAALGRGASPMFAVRAAAAAEGRGTLQSAVTLLIERGVWGVSREDYFAEAKERNETPRFELAAAEALAAAGALEEAIGLVRAALAEDPAGAGSWHVLGRLLRRTGASGEAAAAFLRAAELAPENAAYRRAAGLPPPAAPGH